MHTQIGKWGNSLAVRLPGVYAKDLCLKEGMEVEMSIVNGGILLRPPPKEQTLEDLVSRITPENIHEETDWGPAVGRETW